jgi:hypothetical protein
VPSAIEQIDCRDLGGWTSTASADISGFRESLIAHLRGSDGAILLTGFSANQMEVVAHATATRLGHTDYATSVLIGGYRSEVVGSPAVPAEYAWHTDSTPWVRPNRWTILGLLEGPSEPSGATCILPWSTVVLNGRIGRGALDALMHDGVPWRAQFPDLPPIQAPVLGAVRRWFRPALQSLLHAPGSSPVAAAVAVLAEELAGASRWLEAVIEPGTLLIFDNHAVLHRGPTASDERRRLLRLKVEGRAVE